MTRVYMSIDESNPLEPVPCLHVNGQSLQLSWQELSGLMGELLWLQDRGREARKSCYSILATKYKEEADVR